MNDIIVQSFSRRAARERVFQHLSRSMASPVETVKDNFIVQPYVIRLEQSITTRTEYNFDFYEVQGQQNPSERKLNRNDAFFMSHVALLLAKEDTGITPVVLSNTVLHSFPDPATFSGAGEAADLESIYQALLTFKTDPIERIRDLDTNLFRYEPITTVTTAWGPSLAERGYFELAGEVIFDGAQNNTATLSLNSDATIAAAAGITDELNWIVLMLYGNLVKQGAKKVGEYMS